MREAWAAATGPWVTITIVWLRSSTARCMNVRISDPDRESRLPVGSSAKMIAGLAARARATATRCCWPPDSSLGRWVSRSPRPTMPTTSSTQPASGFRPARSRGSVMFSIAFSVGIRLKLWNTKPTWSRRTWVRSLSLSVVRSVPPMNT
jgi:hypothetical protein